MLTYGPRELNSQRSAARSCLSRYRRVPVPRTPQAYALRSFERARPARCVLPGTVAKPRVAVHGACDLTFFSQLLRRRTVC
jgi:hypothetical protein